MFSIIWEKPSLDSRIAFKFARGSWERVECDKDFKDIENRMLPMVDISGLKPGEKPVTPDTAVLSVGKFTLNTRRLLSASADSP